VAEVFEVLGYCTLDADEYGIRPHIFQTLLLLFPATLER